MDPAGKVKPKRSRSQNHRTQHKKDARRSIQWLQIVDGSGAGAFVTRNITSAPATTTPLNVPNAKQKVCSPKMKWGVNCGRPRSRRSTPSRSRYLCNGMMTMAPMSVKITAVALHAKTLCFITLTRFYAGFVINLGRRFEKSRYRGSPKNERCRQPLDFTGIHGRAGSRAQ